MKAPLLLVLKWISSGAIVAFMAGWATAWVVYPEPDWLFPALVLTIGVGMGSALLYHLVNYLIGDPIEQPHWELETPTSVHELLRQNPVGPLFILIAFNVVAFASFHAENTLHLRTVTAAPLGLVIGTTVWWLLMSAYAKGWVRDE